MARTNCFIFYAPHTGKEIDGDLDGHLGYAGVYVNIVLPSLNVGTVGGGTYLATQRECLNLIGCDEKVDQIFLFPLIGRAKLIIIISVNVK